MTSIACRSKIYDNTTIAWKGEMKYAVVRFFKWEYNLLAVLTVQWWATFRHSWIQGSQAGFLPDWLLFQTQGCPSWWQKGSSNVSHHFSTFLARDWLWLSDSNWTMRSVLDQPWQLARQNPTQSYWLIVGEEWITTKKENIYKYPLKFSGKR